MNILVMFGSESDKETYEPLVAALKREGMHAVLRILSAHKTPAEAEEALKGDYDLYVAGAGLAAHLPGFIAAKTHKPVVGVPCRGAFQGLDALLSTLQMPPGFPVLTAGVGGAAQAAEQIAMAAVTQGVITIVGSPGNPLVQKAEKALREMNIGYQLSNAYRAGCINIMFVPLGEKTFKQDRFIIYVPAAETQAAADAAKLLEMTTQGLWVGVNRAENAAIAAAQLAGKQEEVKKMRKAMKEAVLEADRRQHDS